MVGDLLWVYEGLTQYLGEILAARSGLQSPEEYREEALAATAASAWTHRAGRTWRPARRHGAFGTDSSPCWIGMAKLAARDRLLQRGIAHMA